MSEFGGKKAAVVSLYGQVLAPETFEPTPEIKNLWDKVYNKMREEFGEAVFRSWLKPLTLQAAYHGTLEVSVPTRFMKDWIASHYMLRITEMCTLENSDIKRIEIVVVHGHTESDISTQTNDVSIAKLPNKANVNDLAEKFDLSSPIDPRFKFDTFVVGKSNALAHAAASRVVECNVPFNPLFIYGGVGLGKTHLMHAIAWEMKVKHPEKTVMYLSAEKFMYQFVRAIRAQDTMTFKEIFRSVDVLMIDDIQFIAGKDSTQEEFFHTFNALVDQNKQIIISADHPPSELQGIDEKLRSRMSWGLVADIHQTTYDLRLGILKARCAQIDAHVPDNVLEFLALKITSNIRELEGSLNRIVAHADVTKSVITIDSTQEVLQDLLRSNDKRITIDEIQRQVAEYFGVKISDMHSARRARTVARPRQVAMYLAKQLTSRSLPEIGRKFGGRDHTTVMHAVKKVEELITEDVSFSQDVDALRRLLTS